MLKEKLQKDLLEAMKNKDKDTLNTLRSVKGSFIFSLLLSIYLAKDMTKPTFTNSAGWKIIGPIFNQESAPHCSAPNPHMSTATRSKLDTT